MPDLDSAREPPRSPRSVIVHAVKAAAFVLVFAGVLYLPARDFLRMIAALQKAGAPYEHWRQKPAVLLRLRPLPCELVIALGIERGQRRTGSPMGAEEAAKTDVWITRHLRHCKSVTPGLSGQHHADMWQMWLRAQQEQQQRQTPGQ